MGKQTKPALLVAFLKQEKNLFWKKIIAIFYPPQSIDFIALCFKKPLNLQLKILEICASKKNGILLPNCSASTIFR